MKKLVFASLFLALGTFAVNAQSTPLKKKAQPSKKTAKRLNNHLRNQLSLMKQNMLFLLLMKAEVILQWIKNSQNKRNQRIKRRNIL